MVIIVVVIVIVVIIIIVVVSHFYFFVLLPLLPLPLRRHLIHHILPLLVSVLLVVGGLGVAAVVVVVFFCIHLHLSFFVFPMGLFLHLLLHSVQALGNHFPSWAQVAVIILEPSDNWVQNMSYRAPLFPTVLQTCALLSSALHSHFRYRLLLQLISWL